jgi:hypothetical protein
MLLKEPFLNLGPAPQDLCDLAVSFLASIDWNDNKYRRNEWTLLEGNVIELPFAITMFYTLSPEDPMCLAFMELVNWINTQGGLDTFEPVRGEIAALPQDAKLSRHQDLSWFHYNSRRMHIPLRTNKFSWHSGVENGKEVEYRMLPYQLYEFNNIEYHNGGNGGKDWRVHLIVDFMPRGFLAKSLANGIDPIAKVPPMQMPDWIQA